MKRVKKKNKGPVNPLFEKWLQEWQQKAAKEDNPTQWGFQKALASLKKYPLRMETGQECKILNGFGPKICKMLDKKLEEYKKEKLESGEVDKSEDSDSEGPAAKTNRGNDSSRNPGREKKQKQPKEKAPWIPKKGEGAHALLVTLYKNLTEHGRDYMFREELIDQAQKICNTPMKGNARNHYGAWAAMSNLRKKEFCKTDEKKPAKYSLTDKGVALASVLHDAVNEGASNSSVMPPRNNSPPLHLDSDSDSDHKTGKKPNYHSEFDKLNGIEIEEDGFPRYDPESFNFGPAKDSPKKCNKPNYEDDDGYEVYDPKVWNSVGVANNRNELQDSVCGEDGFQIYDPSKFEDVPISNGGLKKEIEIDLTQDSSYIDFSKQVNVSTSYIDDFDRSWRQRETLQSTPIASKLKPKQRTEKIETTSKSKSASLLDEDVYKPSTNEKSQKSKAKAKSSSILLDEDIFKPSTSGTSSKSKTQPKFVRSLDNDIHKSSTSATKASTYLNNLSDSDEDSLPECNIDFRQKVHLPDDADVELLSDSPSSSPKVIKTVTEQNGAKKSFDDVDVIELLSDDDFVEENKIDDNQKAMALFEDILNSTPKKSAPKSDYVNDDQVFLELCKEIGTSELHPSSKKSPNYMAAISGLDRPANLQQARKNLDDDLIVEDLDEPSITFNKNSFDVILLIDNGETSGNKDRRQCNFDISQEKSGILCERRSLKVGDFTWIAKCRQTKQELVLPYIVERKSSEDLAKSIKDNRFHEQKFRLKRCGVKNVIYLIEKPESKYTGGIPLSALSQAAVNTSVRDNFSVKYTNNHKETVLYLEIMTKILEKKFKGKELKGTMTVRPGSDKCIEFSTFNKFSAKTKNFTVKDMFIRQLMQLSRVSPDVAKKIVNLYPTPRCLAEAYDRKGAEGENLLKDVQYGNLSKRRIGAAISKTLYQLYTKNVFS